MVFNVTYPKLHSDVSAIIPMKIIQFDCYGSETNTESELFLQLRKFEVCRFQTI